MAAAANSPTYNPTLGRAFGAMGMGAGAAGLLFGGNNPADASMNYLNQISKTVQPYYQPYMDAGTQALPQLETQYTNLLTNPGGTLNQIGTSYQQSPGYQFALDQALQASNQASAAGGMAGSPQSQQQSMQLAIDLANQDYYNWLNQATGLYTTGLQGESGLAHMGYGATNDYANQVAQTLAAQSMLQYMGQMAENQATGSSLGNLLGGAATLAAFW